MALTEAARNMKEMSDNPYLGRFVAAGRMENGDFVQLWGITGRSPDSKNRVIVKDGDVLKTDAFDWSTLGNPINIIYNGMNTVDRKIYIASNGNQTDTIVSAMSVLYPLRSMVFSEFEGALRPRRDEGVNTKFTPRITVLTDARTGEIIFSNITRATQNPADPDRPIHTYHRVQAEPTEGFYIRTYSEGTDDLPSFREQPIPIGFRGTIDNVFEMYWNIMIGPNRVALAVRTFTQDGILEDRFDNELKAA